MTEYSRRETVVVHRAVHPATATEVVEVVREARQTGGQIRIRGRGHNLAGLTMPQGVSETVLFTDRLNHWAVDVTRSTVKAGAGIPIYHLRQHLRGMGVEVRVVNHGEMSGPSVGGYVAAGGFGNGSEKYGGFWATVRRLTVVNGRGDVLHLTPENEAFWWMFGSMGELGVIVDVDMAVDIVDERAVPVSTRTGRLDLPAPLATGDYPETIYWFTIFSPPGDQARVNDALSIVEREFAGALRWRPHYRYAIAASRRHPPLVYGGKGAIAATGIWGDAVTGTPDLIPGLSREVSQLVAKNPSWRRYVQTEYVSGADDYVASLPADVRTAFDRWRREFDPEDVFPDVIPRGAIR